MPKERIYKFKLKCGVGEAMPAKYTLFCTV